MRGVGGFGGLFSPPPPDVKGRRRSTHGCAAGRCGAAVGCRVPPPAGTAAAGFPGGMLRWEAGGGPEPRGGRPRPRAAPGPPRPASARVPAGRFPLRSRLPPAQPFRSVPNGTVSPAAGGPQSRCSPAQEPPSVPRAGFSGESVGVLAARRAHPEGPFAPPPPPLPFAVAQRCPCLGAFRGAVPRSPGRRGRLELHLLGAVTLLLPRLQPAPVGLAAAQAAWRSDAVASPADSPGAVGIPLPPALVCA